MLGEENSQLTAVSDRRWAQAGNSRILPVQEEILPGCGKACPCDGLKNYFM